MRMLKCPRCKGKSAYLSFGIDTRRDGQSWRYKQKLCSACPYVGNKSYTIPIRKEVK